MNTNFDAQERKRREAFLVRAIDLYGSFILQILKERCCDQQLAEEISQKLWVYFYTYRPVEEFEHPGFLKRKAFQLYIDEGRRRDVRPKLCFPDTLPQSVKKEEFNQPDYTTEELLYERFWERFEELNLPRLQRDIFWLHHHHGYTMKEVSKRLGTPPSTAHDHLKKLKAQCLQFLTSADSSG